MATEAARLGRFERLLLAAILLLYLAIGALYALRVPPYNAPDEPAHANYVRDLAERAQLPVLQSGDWDADLLERLKAQRFPPDADVSAIRYESHQPPLYYLAAAPVAWLTVRLGERGQLVAIRLATLVLGAAALAVLHRAGQVVLPGDPAARLMAVALAAFIPMHLSVGASVSNDVAAELVLTVVLWRCLVVLRDGVDQRGAFLLGLLAGVGALTKLSAYVAFPLAFVALLGAHGAPRANGASPGYVVAARLGAAGLGAALLVVPWLLRGALVYGLDDPLGLRRHDLVVEGQERTGPLTATLVAQAGATLFRSFWGQFGWMGVLMDERVYLLLAAFTLVLLGGLLLWLAPWGGFWHDLEPLQRRGMALAGLLVVTVALGTLGYNLTYLQPQGRYLFPAMSGIALLATCGLRELVVPRQRTPVYLTVVVALVTLDLVALFRFIVPALAS